MTTPTAPPAAALADQFAALTEQLKDALEGLEGVLAHPDLAAVARAARPWRRYLDLAVGCEENVTVDDTLAELRALARPPQLSRSESGIVVMPS